MITIDDFKKLEIKIGKIVSAERVEGSEKLLKLEVDLGGEVRQLVAGIAGFYEPEYLVGKQIPVLTNLEPRVLRGVESQGMTLCASDNGKPVLLCPEAEVPLGSEVR
jgi:methionine--tRNA ligase beta chain